MKDGLKGSYSPKKAMLGLYWGYVWIMEKKMETIIMGYIGYRISMSYCQYSPY